MTNRLNHFLPNRFVPMTLLRIIFAQLFMFRLWSEDFFLSYKSMIADLFEIGFLKASFFFSMCKHRLIRVGMEKRQKVSACGIALILRPFTTPTQTYSFPFSDRLTNWTTFNLLILSQWFVQLRSARVSGQTRAGRPGRARYVPVQK